ncbi:MAG: hypothetical protein JSW39_11130 [Desulfobacterales bacterium]|nr:MAG: hypothetical protein JSW39_11130 [Desulfobacterales bacterium]
MKCPVCGGLNFYVKDPDDEYETYEFELKEGGASFASETAAAKPPDVREQTETYCNKCAWHGKFGALTKN